MLSPTDCLHITTALPIKLSTDGTNFEAVNESQAPDTILDPLFAKFFRTVKRCVEGVHGETTVMWQSTGFPAIDLWMTVAGIVLQSDLVHFVNSQQLSTVTGRRSVGKNIKELEADKGHSMIFGAWDEPLFQQATDQGLRVVTWVPMNHESAHTHALFPTPLHGMLTMYEGISRDSLALLINHFNLGAMIGRSVAFEGRLGLVDILHLVFGGNVPMIVAADEICRVSMDNVEPQLSEVLYLCQHGQEVYNRLCAEMGTNVFAPCNMSVDVVKRPEMEPNAVWYLLNQPFVSDAEVVGRREVVPSESDHSLSILAWDSVNEGPFDLPSWPSLLVPTPPLLTDNSLLQSGRWNLTMDESSETELMSLCATRPILQTRATNMLNAVVEMKRRHGRSLRNGSWNLTGTSGRGKSTALLCCAAAWFADRAKYRVAYLPAAYVDVSLEEAIWSSIIFAFHGDSIMPLLFDLRRENYSINFAQIDRFLEARALFLVLIIDQINDILDPKGIETLNKIRKSFRLGAKNRLLMTASSQNNMYRSMTGDVTIDFGSGLLEEEVKWHVMSQYRLFRNPLVELEHRVSSPLSTGSASESFLGSPAPSDFSAPPSAPETRIAPTESPESFVESVIKILGTRVIDITFDIDQLSHQNATVPYQQALDENAIHQRYRHVRGAIKKKLLDFKRHDVVRDLVDNFMSGPVSMVANNSVVPSRFGLEVMDKRFMKMLHMPVSFTEHEENMPAVAISFNGSFEEYEGLMARESFRAALKRDALWYMVMAAEKISFDIYLEDLHEYLCEHFVRYSSVAFQRHDSADIKLEQMLMVDFAVGMSELSFHQVDVCRYDDEATKIGLKRSNSLDTIFLTGLHVLRPASDEAYIKPYLTNRVKMVGQIGGASGNATFLFKCAPNQEAVDFVMATTIADRLETYGIQVTMSQSDLITKLAKSAIGFANLATKDFPIFFSPNDDSLILIFLTSFDPFSGYQQTRCSIDSVKGQLLEELEEKMSEGKLKVFLAHLGGTPGNRVSMKACNEWIGSLGILPISERAIRRRRLQ